jgi:hypothetical protein
MKGEEAKKQRRKRRFVKPGNKKPNLTKKGK